MAVHVLNWGAVDPARDLHALMVSTDACGPPATTLSACVALPARNEAETLPAAIDALTSQVDTEGRALPPGTVEIVVVLNNCTDDSKAAALAAASRQALLIVVELDLAQEDAHVGWARRIAMDVSERRLRASRAARPLILTTDADSIVAPDWIAANLAEAGAGSDVVGGDIHVRAGHVERLPRNVRRCIELERHFRHLLGSLIDHQLGDAGVITCKDAWCTGASLALTRSSYLRIGRLTPVPRREDVLCVREARACGARIRHSAAVRVTTSCRLDGRASGGMAGTLRRWSDIGPSGLLVSDLDRLFLGRTRPRHALLAQPLPIEDAIRTLEQLT